MVLKWNTFPIWERNQSSYLTRINRDFIRNKSLEEKNRKEKKTGVVNMVEFYSGSGFQTKRSICSTKNRVIWNLVWENDTFIFLHKTASTLIFFSEKLKYKEAILSYKSIKNRKRPNDQDYYSWYKERTFTFTFTSFNNVSQQHSCKQKWRQILLWLTFNCENHSRFSCIE